MTYDEAKAAYDAALAALAQVEEQRLAEAAKLVEAALEGLEVTGKEARLRQVRCTVAEVTGFLELAAKLGTRDVVVTIKDFDKGSMVLSVVW